MIKIPLSNGTELSLDVADESVRIATANPAETTKGRVIAVQIPLTDLRRVAKIIGNLMRFFSPLDRK